MRSESNQALCYPKATATKEVGILLKIRIFMKIQKHYFRGSSIICSWKFSPLLLTVLAKILSRGAFEKHISWFSWKVMKQLWICYQVLVLFPETPWGFSSVLLLWVYIICFWYHFLTVHWVIGSKFECSMFVFLSNFKSVFWCVTLFICAVVKPANRIWNYTYGVQLPQTLSAQVICFFC